MRSFFIGLFSPLMFFVVVDAFAQKGTSSSKPTGGNWPPLSFSVDTPERALAAQRESQEATMQPWTKVTNKTSPELTRITIPFLGKRLQFEKKKGEK